MDFIKVTLRENFASGKKITESGRLEGYLLPILAIQSISKNLMNDDYRIDIIDSYIPTNLEFTVHYAEAKLPDRFINVLN